MKNGLFSTIGNIFTGILGAGASVKQAKIDAQVARENTMLTNKANREMAEYAYSKDLEMWNKANEYNRPEAQMERLSNAGLNPNLVYGNGSVGNSSATIPHYQAPRQEYNYKPTTNLPETISMFQNLTMRQAQVDNFRKQNQVLDAESRIREAKARMAEIDATYYGNYLGAPYHGVGATKYYSANYQMEYRQKQLEKIEAEVKKILLDNMLKQKDVNWYTAKNLTNIASKAIASFGIGRIFNQSAKYGRNKLQPPRTSNQRPRTVLYEYY